MAVGAPNRVDPTLFAVCVFLALAVLAVFGQTAHFGFINYDDNLYVYENPMVQNGLTWKGALWALSYGEIGHWHPLTWLTHEADCQVYGLWAGGHHLTNVALHGLTTVLLFLVLRAMTGALWRSALVAAVFAVHPLRAESVAWIAERKDVLSGMFFMLTLWAYVRYARQPSRGRYAAMALLYGLGLLSKNMLVTLPFVLLLLDWWPMRRLKAEGKRLKAEGGERRPAGLPFWGLVREKIPLLLLSAAICLVTAYVPEHVGNLDRKPVLERIANALVSCVVYLQQIVFPVDLSVPYLFPSGGTPLWKAGLAFFALAGATAVAVECRRKRPYLLAGWLWYLGMLVPVIGLAQISYYARADRYTYLPGIGLAIAGIWAAADLSAGWRHRRLLGSGLATVILAALIFRAHSQTFYWRQSEALWTHTLSLDPANTFARNNLGNALLKDGRFEEAIAQYHKSLEINPGSAETHNDLGGALFSQANMDDAIAQYGKALEIDPDYLEARNNLGLAYFTKGETTEAIAQYRMVLEGKPGAPGVHSNPGLATVARFNLGNALIKEGKFDEAIAQYRMALEINPDSAKAHNGLGMALFSQGHLDEAIAQYRMALETEPDYVQGRNNRKGETDQAIVQYRKSLESKPGDPAAHYNLGLAFFMKGETDQAIAQYRKVLESQPSSADTQFAADTRVTLATALLTKGETDEAIAQYRKALESAPQNAEARHNLGIALATKGKLDEAIAQYRLALAINPAQPQVLNDLAWALATASDSSLRDGAEAVALAGQANQLTSGGNAIILATLAAAYAEAGRYDAAAAAARKALNLAEAQKDMKLAGAVQEAMKLYEGGRPMRETK